MWLKYYVMVDLHSEYSFVFTDQISHDIFVWSGVCGKCLIVCTEQFSHNVLVLGFLMMQSRFRADGFTYHVCLLTFLMIYSKCDSDDSYYFLVV